MRRTERVATVAVATLLGALVPLLVVGSPGTGPEHEDAIRAGALPVVERVDRDAHPPRARGGRRSGDQPDAGPAVLPEPPPLVVPTSLTIPTLDLRMPVAAYGIDREGLMALPDTTRQLAWYRFGPHPWSARGATVIAGHVDTAEEGSGPLARLGALVPGDEVVIESPRRDPLVYRVVAVRRVAKAVLDLPALFSRRGPPRLHLVTCGGVFLADDGGYQDNVVVVARPVR